MKMSKIGPPGKMVTVVDVSSSTSGPVPPRQRVLVCPPSPLRSGTWSRQTEGSTGGDVRGGRVPLLTNQDVAVITRTTVVPLLDGNTDDSPTFQ